MTPQVAGRLRKLAWRSVFARLDGRTPEALRHERAADALMSYWLGRVERVARQEFYGAERVDALKAWHENQAWQAEVRAHDPFSRAVKP